MNREEKASNVAELKEMLGHAASVVVAGFSGLTVEEANGLRSEFKKAGCQYHVVKNTLFRLAVAGTAMEGMGPIFKGTSAIAFSTNDPSAPAKVLDKFAATNAHLHVKGGYLEGKVLDDKGVRSLANMKGKDDLRAELLATFMAPAQNFVALLIAAPQNFMYLLSAKERAMGGTEG